MATVTNLVERRESQPWPKLRRVEAIICDDCLDGKPSECHTPGCVFWCCPSITEEQGERLRAALDGAE